MRRQSTLPLLIVTLLLGIVVGSTADQWSIPAEVEAHALLQGSGQQGSGQTSAGRSESTGSPNPFIAGSRHLAQIVQKTAPSVVHIQSRRRIRGSTLQETGSGVLISTDKASGVFVVTNRHVIDGTDSENIRIRLHNGREIHPDRIWTDPASDVAVMQVDVENVTLAQWGDSDAARIGNFVLALGSPFGLSRSVTLGIISAKGRRSLQLDRGNGILNQDFLQTDAAINPGNSGGPLVDMHGRVIGINAAIASNSGGNEGIGFSIPSNLVRRIVDQLIQHNRVKRAYLGVRLDPDFDYPAARRLDLAKVRGARIVEVYPETPASRAELRRNDVVVRFNNTPVQDENHLINLVSLTPVGNRVTLTIWRDGQTVELQIRLTQRSKSRNGSR